MKQWPMKNRGFPARSFYLFFIAIAMAFIGPRASAEESWDAGFAASGVLQADISANAVWKQASPDGERGWKEEEYTLSVERASPSGWSLTSVRKSGESRSLLDSRFRLVRETQSILDASLAKKIGMDRIDWSIAGDQARYTVFLGGKQKSDKTVKLSPDSTFITILTAQLQALVAGGRLESRDFGLMFGDRKVDSNVRFLRVSDPLSVAGKESRFPPAFREALPPGEYTVVDFSLTGVFRAIYPHHSYFVYRRVAGAWRFVASWSGKPSELQCDWAVR